MKYIKRIARTALIFSIATLMGCGGSGGGGGGASSSTASPTPSGFTLSGTITLPDTATVDSDTNDTNQSGWSSNNTVATAQSISTPIQLLGYLNTANTGPSGKTYLEGDEIDVFKLSLSAGQVVELLFSNAVTNTDIDMVLIDADSAAISGYSEASTGNRECISITRSGNYYLAPYVYTTSTLKGAAIYSLRIGSPGESTPCSNSSSSTELFVPGELVSREKAKTPGILGALSSFILNTRSPDERIPQRLKVPNLQALSTPLGLSASSRQTLADAALHSARATLSYAKELQASGEYEYVEPNFRLDMQASYTPNDPSYVPQRWHYEQINLPSAMDRILALSVTPSTRPLVAVIDSGIVNDHPDLQAQISGGYSFITTSLNGDGNTSNPNDPSSSSYCSNHVCWHGSHVAGTIAAVSDNSQYGAGVAKMAQLMPLRVFTPGAGATSYDVTQAILYAAGLANNSSTLPARKADVINMSLGGSGACPTQFASAIAQARAQNVIVVAAAGNSNTIVGMPANCAGVISVGALDALKKKTSYSNYGSTLSLSAPGGDSTQSSTGTGYPDSVYSTLGAYSGSTRIASFGAMTGTSMASPHVAGVMALMRYVNPAITPSQIDTLIASGKLTDDLYTSGRDDLSGYGLINARKAVDEALLLASSGGSLEGIVVPSPSSISFGSSLTSATLTLSTTAASSETVTSISANSAAITITPGSSVDATTRLGSYTLGLNRSSLPVGTSYPVITITTSTSRSIAVQLTVVKLAANTSALASFGSVWVQATQADTGAVLARQRFNVSSGAYNWSLSGIPVRNVTLIASTDLDNDLNFCELGEACGDHPGSAQSLSIVGNLSGLNFSIAPTLSSSP